MHFFLAIIGIIFAYELNENIFLWGIIGYLTGLMITTPGRISRLETQCRLLKEELDSFKNNTSEKINDSLSTDNAPDSKEAGKQPPPMPLIDIVEQPDPFSTVKESSVTEANVENSNPWTQNKLQTHAYNSNNKRAEASDIEKLIKLIFSWFTDGNTFVRIGIVILFIGVSFLLNFAIDKGMISIELRLAAVAIAAIIILVIGWNLRTTKTAYALLIQGGGIGLLYLTVYASFSLYHVVPSLPAFALLILIAVLATTLAILQDALSLALFAAIGGFLAPVLSSTGSNNYIALFSFYTLLNSGIFAVAWFKRWRILNLVGFIFTFSISTFWGATRYQAEFFSTTEPFLILFFLFYVGISILYAIKKAPDLKDTIDGTLIFGTPLLAFGLQAAMVNPFQYGVAISAFSLSLFYLILALVCRRRLSDELNLLTETFVSICVIFATLVIPFAFDDSTTSAAWAIEGTGILWISIRQQQFIRRIFALLLQFFSALLLLSDSAVANSTAFLNSSFIGVALISFCAGLSSWMLYQPFVKRRSVEKQLSPWLLAYSLLWLYCGFEYEIISHHLDKYHAELLLSLTACIYIGFNRLANRLDWLHIRYAALTMLLPMIYAALITLLLSSHPAAHYGIFLWPLAFVIYFKILKDSSPVNQTIVYRLHLFSAIFLALLLFWEGYWQLLLVATLLSLLFYKIAWHWDWPQMRILAFGLLPVMLFIVIGILFNQQIHPFALPDHRMNIDWPVALGGILWLFAFAVMYRLFSQEDKQTATLQYIPLFHALTLLLLVIIPIWEASWQLSFYLPLHNGWHIALIPVTAITALWLIMQPKFWPFDSHYNAYMRFAAVPLIWGLSLWSIFALKSAGNSAPLPWFPIVNPADIMQLILILTLIRFTALIPVQLWPEINKQNRYQAIAGLSFIWLNVVLLRGVHHWGGIPWSIELISTPVAQTSISIFWALSGLLLTIISNQKQLRNLWISGAVLFVIVVIKLFIFDLAAHGTIARIISFIGVGALLMLIGYFAPLPPEREQKATS